MPVRLLAREVDRQRVPAEVSVVPDAQFVAELDGLVTLGGDGTMLGGMRLVIDRPVPVLGVNHGNLGFLVEVTPDQLPSALKRLAVGDFCIEQYACLEVDVGEVDLAIRFGFNDVVLGRSRRAGAVSLDLSVNDLNYAAGGPVLSPSSGAVVITPVAPLSGISRPVVLGAEDQVCFTAAEDSAPVAIDVDGISAGELGRGGRLTATVRPEAGQVVRLSKGDYAKRSRVKLSLLDLPLRPDQLLELIPPELRRNV
jgi:NAD+ kinase